MEQHLKRVYYDSSNAGSYGGVQRLWKVVKSHGYKLKDVKEWVKSQESYNLHKPVRRKFTRARVIARGIDAQWQADLVEMQEFARQNGGTRYLLTVIDVVSKFAWVVLLRSKTAVVVRDAFSAILAMGRHPRKLQTDRGTEFYNTKMAHLLAANDIIHFSTHNNETKASIVERFNRTLKTDMWHYFTAKNTRKYTDVIQRLVSAYNNRYHRSIKMKPSAVSNENVARVLTNLYGKTLVQRPKPQPLAVGDTVMISKSKRTFDKGYLPNWTYEQFVVDEVVTPKVNHRFLDSSVRYKLKDEDGETLEGTFYASELQKTRPREVTQIEKIIRRRGNNVLVKWVGYPDKFNQWIPAVNVHKID